MGSKDLIIAQNDLAASLGISPDDLKKIREKNLAVEDWAPGRPVRYTAIGVQKIRAALGLPDAPEGVSSSADAGTEKKAGRFTELVVIAPARGNTRIVRCRNPLDPDAGELRLRVKTNVHFTAGMRVPSCVQSRLHPSLFDYEGRLPRWKGRF